MRSRTPPPPLKTVEMLIGCGRRQYTVFKLTHQSSFEDFSSLRPGRAHVPSNGTERKTAPKGCVTELVDTDKVCLSNQWKTDVHYANELSVYVNISAARSKLHVRRTGQVLNQVPARLQLLHAPSAVGGRPRKRLG